MLGLPPLQYFSISPHQTHTLLPEEAVEVTAATSTEILGSVWSSGVSAESGSSTSVAAMLHFKKGKLIRATI